MDVVYALGIGDVNDTTRYGCVSFFCTKQGGGKIQEKNPGEKQKDESQEEQTGTEPADATGERRAARRAGDDAMEERAPACDVGRDRSGSG